MSAGKISVYLEVGAKKTFAGAIEWPGWCRGGRDEAAALQALFDYAPRYSRALARADLAFSMPGSLTALEVVERLAGNAATDFGAPNLAPSDDSQPLDETGLARFHALLKACWQAFDAAAQAAEGKELRLGPRGGGRDLAGMTRHVLDAQAGYLGRLAWKLPASEGADLQMRLRQTRQAVLDGLNQAARRGVAPVGPRGGVRWTARYFVRRSAWHVLDHAWEIEDRVLEG